MKKINKLATLILVMFCSLTSMAQVGIGTNTPNANAVLEVVSTTQGMLFPRMTTAQRDGIANPAEGLTIFNTDLSSLQTNISSTGTANWKSFLQPSSAKLGATYTTHYNGIVGGVHSTSSSDPTYFGLSTYTSGETFNNNTTCANKLISAQGCGGLTTVTGASGTVYNLVDINGQCWMKENSQEIPSTYNPAPTWSSSDVGWHGFYSNGSSAPVSGEGRLYQWSAAMNGATTERAQGVCPDGFHVPSDCEWMYLEHGQGMKITDQTINNSYRADTNSNLGTPGYKLRNQGTGATNASGFSGLLTGVRTPSGSYCCRSNTGGTGIRSSTETSATQANARWLQSVNRGIYRNSYSKAESFTVRCLKD